MKLIKYIFVLGILFVGLVLGSRGLQWYKVKRAQQIKMEQAEASSKRAQYALIEKQKRSEDIRERYPIDPDASEQEARARWESAKQRGSLPDQPASLSGQGTVTNGTVRSR